MKHLSSLLALWAAIGGLVCSAHADDSKPNIVVVLLDDAGWRDVGFMGNDYIETPVMDRLAAEGMAFTNAYATHPFCAPTRQSMISGQWPARTAWMQRSEVANPDSPRKGREFSPSTAWTWTQRHPEFISLAEALGDAGYATAHIGKWHFGLQADVSPESEGFHKNFGGAVNVGAVKDFFAPFAGLPGKVESTPGEYLTDRLTDEAIQFIREHRASPFFVQLWHYAPHTPIQAPEEVVRKYREKRNKLGDHGLNPTYAAMMDRIDQGIGRLLAALEEMGLRENTVILLTSDNGAQVTLGSIPVTSVAPLRGQKGELYEGGIRVPMAIHWPGKTRPGCTSDHVVSVLDFYPTILDMAGVELPNSQPVDGTSLVPLLRGGPQPELAERKHYWYNVTSDIIEDGSLILPGAAVRESDWKLLKFFQQPPRLYNLADDPGESRDLAEAQPEIAARLDQALEAWLEETGVAIPTRNPAYDPEYVVPHQVEEIPF